MAKLISSTVACIFALWAVAALTGRATAAPANLDDCGPLVFNNLMDCMMFLSDEGDEAKPEQSCCTGLQKVVNANWNCVCFAISGSATIGMEISMTKAEALPAACGVSAPPVSTCYDNPPTTMAQPSPHVSEPIIEAPVPSLHYHYAPASSPEH